MAFLDVGNDTNGYGYAFFNVTAAVGGGQCNMTEDVLLVQFLLERYYENYPQMKPEGRMTVNGVCDSITMKWIRKFQYQTGAIFEDGIVDRAKTRTSFSAISRTLYTIIFLNGMLRVNDPNWFYTLRTNPSVPLPLRQTFMCVMVGGGAPVSSF
jgi:hypothetical protein